MFKLILIDQIEFTIEGPGSLVATDNGSPANFTPFPSSVRKAYNGLALAIIRSKQGESGSVKVTATSSGLEEAQVIINSK
jgi:beta-galactosidase